MFRTVLSLLGKGFTPPLLHSSQVVWNMCSIWREAGCRRDEH